jgi:hypothetical protein
MLIEVQNGFCPASAVLRQELTRGKQIVIIGGLL